MELNSNEFKIFGSISILIVGWQIVRKVLPWIYSNIIGPNLFGPRIDLTKMGEWAVVTGATDGIGKAYAKALAKQGLHLVLISRSLDKLEAVSKELVKEYGVEVKVIDVDFTHGEEIYEKIEKKIQGLDIGILVNNIGISYSHPDYFLNCTKDDPTFLRNIISANIYSVTHMCQLVMPLMVEKKRGVVINISSAAAVIPNPLLAVYSATKAFVNKFSEDLDTEYRNEGITIQSVLPGFVATNMSKIRKPSIYAPSPDTYVNSALKTLGISGQTAGYIPHSFLILVIDSVKSVFGEQFARNFVFNNLLATRKKALRYNAAKKEK